MKRKGEAAEEEEEQHQHQHQHQHQVKKRHIFSTCKVVEYLGPLMSRDLMFKFPDNSAFDFDYSQSSIWSPLVPRLHCPIDLDSDDFVTPRKLTFGFGILHLDDNNNNNSSKKVCSTIKKKLKIMKKKKKKKKILASGFSPTPVKGACVPFTTKGWNRMLKAATKHFKKKKKKDCTGGHVKLSNYLTNFRN